MGTKLTRRLIKDGKVTKTIERVRGSCRGGKLGVFRGLQSRVVRKMLRSFPQNRCSAKIETVTVTSSPTFNSNLSFVCLCVRVCLSVCASAYVGATKMFKGGRMLS